MNKIIITLLLSIPACINGMKRGEKHPMGEQPAAEASDRSSKKSKTAAATVSTAATTAFPTTASAASASSTPATAAAASAPVAPADVKTGEKSILDIMGQPKELEKIVSEYVGSHFGGGEYQLVGNLSAHPFEASELSMPRSLEERGMRALVYSPDGNYLFSARNNEIKVWDAVTLNLLDTLKTTGQIYALAVAQDSSYFVTIEEIHSFSWISYWDTNTHKIFAIDIIREPVWKAVFSADGQYLILGSIRDQILVHKTTRSGLGKLVTEKPTRTSNENISISANGTRLATSGIGEHFTVFTMPDLKEICHTAKKGLDTSNVSFSPESAYFVTGGDALTISRSEDCWPIAKLNTDAVIQKVAFLSDGDHVVYIDKQGALKIVDIEPIIAGRTELEAPEEIAPIKFASLLAISPRDDIAVGTKDGNIHVFGKRLIETSGQPKVAKAALQQTGKKIYQEVGRFPMVMFIKLPPETAGYATSKTEKVTEVD